MKKSASDAMNLVKKQQEGGNSEAEELRNENEKLSQQIEDLNLQLLQQHIAKECFYESCLMTSLCNVMTSPCNVMHF